MQFTLQRPTAPARGHRVSRDTVVALAGVRCFVPAGTPCDAPSTLAPYTFDDEGNRKLLPCTFVRPTEDQLEGWSEAHRELWVSQGGAVHSWEVE